MRMAGGCCLICALLCVVITVTTTVVHMNRLQTLHECVYTPQSKTCMCVSAIGDHNAQEGKLKLMYVLIFKQKFYFKNNTEIYSLNLFKHSKN